LPSRYMNLIKGESSIGDDPPERAGSKRLMVGNDHPRVRLVAAEDHMAAGLATENEPGALQRSTGFKAGQIGGELGDAWIPRGHAKRPLTLPRFPQTPYLPRWGRDRRHHDNPRRKAQWLHGCCSELRCACRLG